MQDLKRVGSALVSVYYKDGLEPVLRLLNDRGVTLYATGGTYDFILSLGIPVCSVEDITGFPEILGGRVKTLHPKVFGGILSRRDNGTDQVQLDTHQIPHIDLVMVDLYPFAETLASGASEQDIIEKIDIGGISLIRAAAKNFSDVVIIPSRDDYSALFNELSANDGQTTLGFRKSMAAKAFGVSSHYDTDIHRWFAGDDTSYFKHSVSNSKVLRYGENPHQQGIFYGELNQVFEQLSGKELSYNNLLDIDAALNLVSDFTEPVTAILKHNNACGVSCGPDPMINWQRALESDPVSAFGGIIVTTSEVDRNQAEEIGKLFFEVLMAPSFTPEALHVLSGKKNRIILKLKNIRPNTKQFRSVLNGVLWQDADLKKETASDLQCVTEFRPDQSQIDDLLFANTVAKYSRSNTIVLARGKRLIAAGVGQTSRVDALKQAIDKAAHFGLDLNGAVMASDAFFPFPDCVEIADKAGIKAVIQPGGSIRDQDSIEYCNAHGMIMVLTGTRHFRH
jgi:phosphoribosylaminoimidazolecarboxamide formyltransferase / IMP cyclohydrolase